MSEDSNDPEGERAREVERIRKEIKEQQADPFKPFLAISEAARKAASAAGYNSPQGKRIVIGKVGWALLLLSSVVLTYGVYRYWEYEKYSKLRQTLQDEEISSMATRYNAVIDWRKPLEQIDEADITGIQEALIKKDGRPILLSVNMMELVSTDNKNEAHFSEFGLPDPEVDFILECSPEQTNKLRERSVKENEFAVIALITSISRPEDSPILAKGRCIDLLWIY